MPRIPRIEQTVPYRAAEMPFSSGDGYQAPGRALQKLGSAIADAGKGFASLAAGMEGEADKENDFKDKMTLLQYKNDLHLNEVEARAAYDGDGTDYAQSRAQFYQDRSAETLAKISPKNRQMASLSIESGRGQYVGSAMEYGNTVRKQKLYASTEATLTSEVGKLALVEDPAERMQRFEAVLAGTEAIINSYPGSEPQRERLRAHAASQLGSFLEKIPPLEAGPAAQKLRERLGTLQPQTSGPGEPGKVGGQMHNYRGDYNPENWPDYRGRGGPAAIRYNNPGAQWPGPSARKFGGDTSVTLKDGQGNKIAIFPTVVHGGAAQFDLLERRYTGKTLLSAIRTWSGGNSSVAYAQKVARETGLTTGTVLTKDMVRDPRIAIPIAKAMASHEGGKPYPMSDAQWMAAHRMALGGPMRDDAPPQVAESTTPTRQAAADILSRGKKFDQLTPKERETVYSGLYESGVLSDGVNRGGDRSLITKGDPKIAALLDKKDRTPEEQNIVNDAIRKSGLIDDGVDRGEGRQVIARADIPQRIKEKMVRGEKLTDAEHKQVQDGLMRSGVLDDLVQRGDARQQLIDRVRGGGQQATTGPDKITVSLKGLTDEQKAAKLDELGRQGYRGFSYRLDDNERLIAQKADKFDWSPRGRGPTDAPVADGETNDVRDPNRFSGPGWAKEPIGKFQRGEYDRPANTIPGTKVADASGQTGGVVRKGGSVAGMLLEGINKQLPDIQKRHVKAVETLVESVEKRAREGYAPTDEELAKVKGYVDGLGMPEMTARLETAVAAAQTTSQLQRMPPDQVAKIAQTQRAELAAKGKKASVGELAQVDFLESLADNTRKALDKDQIGHAIAVGLVPAQEPLDPRNLSVEQMMARKDAAEVAAEAFDRPVKYFSADEKVVFAEAMNRGGTELLGTLKTMYEALGPDTPKLMAEFGKEAPEAATLGWLVANGQRQQVLTDIADGLQLIRSDGFKSRIPKATDLRSEAGTILGNAFVETPKAQQAVIDTARVLYEWRAHRKGLDPAKDALDTDLWEQSVRDVLGEREVNGEKFGGVYEQKTGGFLGIGGTATNAIIPTNVKQDRFRDLIESIRLSDLLPNEAVPAQSPGVPVPPGEPGIPMLAQAEFARNSQEGEAPKGKAGQITSAAGLSAITEQRAYPIMDREGKPLSVKAIRQSKLVTVGPGRYLMALGDPLAEDPEYIMGRDGEPYMLDLNELEPRLRLRNPTYYAPE